MAPSTAAATCSGPAKLESSSIAMSRDDFDFRCRKAVPAALRNVAAVNASGLPPPTSSNRRAFSPAGRCSSATSVAFPLNSFDSYNSRVSSANRSPGGPSNATIISASHSIVSTGCRFSFVIIRFSLFPATCWRGWRRALRTRPCAPARLRACRAASCRAPPPVRT